MDSRTRDGAPNPEHAIAARLTRLESLAWPAAMIWKPLHSISGKWEASGTNPDGSPWTLIEKNPSEFADKLQAKLTENGVDGA